MNKNIELELEELARDVAQDVAGKGSVEQVKVVSGEDASDRPVYYFSFLIDQGRSKTRAGLVRIRLLQRLRDELIAQGDEHFPVIQIFDRQDWDKRTGA